MIVDEDYRRRGLADRGPEGLPGMNEGCGEGPDGYDLILDYLVFRIEEGASEHLFLEVLHSWLIVRDDVSARAERRAGQARLLVPPPNSIEALISAILSGPMPLMPFFPRNSLMPACAMPSRPPNFSSSSMPRSTAERPSRPFRMMIARSCASESPSTPYFRSRSLGRSSSGHSLTLFFRSSGTGWSPRRNAPSRQRMR